MLVSPTEDSKKLLAAFSRVLINGRCEFSTSVQIAQLALKHRKNKNGGQRIVVFLGSPINETEEQLTKIGKQLKKNNIAVDVVIMGEIDEIQAKMLAFINATNSSDNR
jgi:26S proteasome regulatory subunit N10